MSTDLKSHAQGVSLTRFANGGQGTSVQVTMRKERPVGTEFFDHLQLTRAQAAALAADLMDFAQGREVEEDCDCYGCTTMRHACINENKETA